MKKARVRRQRIPAFGEWNCDYAGYGDWPVTHYFDSALQLQAGGLVMPLPPSPKQAHSKVVKWSTGSATLEVDDEKQQQQKHKVVVGFAAEHGATKKQQQQQMGKQSGRVSDSDAQASYNYKACRPVKAVDQDLYDIPPDMLCHKPRKRVTRRLWIGCLGLSCVVT